MASLYPPVGSWYQELTTSKQFEIVSIDEKEGLVEVQFRDGNTEEYSVQSWSNMKIIAISSEEVSSNSNFEIDEDYMYDNEFDEDFNTAYGQQEPDSFGGYDDLY